MGAIVIRPNGRWQSRNDVVDWPYIWDKDMDIEDFEDWNYDLLEYERQTDWHVKYRNKADMFECIYDNIENLDPQSREEFQEECYYDRHQQLLLDESRWK